MSNLKLFSPSGQDTTEKKKNQNTELKSKINISEFNTQDFKSKIKALKQTYEDTTQNSTITLAQIEISILENFNEPIINRKGRPKKDEMQKPNYPECPYFYTPIIDLINVEQPYDKPNVTDKYRISN